MCTVSLSDMDDHQWNDLPDTALINIYLCLQDRWRINMAMACHNWNRVFASPCLWRTRYMQLGGYRPVSTGEKVCKFAESHGAHLRYLYLSCNHPTIHSCKVIQFTIDDFFNKIQNCRLINFELERLNLDTFWKFENLKNKVVVSLARFLRRQRNLQYFNMNDAHFSVTSGCRILEHVGGSSGSSLRHLCLEDFFRSRLPMFQVKRFRNAFSKFTNLSSLLVNYSCLSDDILQCLATNLAGKLKDISCRIYRNEPHYHRISSVSWEKLKSVCPELFVDFWFEGIGMSSEIIPILVPEAPVRQLHIWTGYDDSADWQLSQTINHIATHHKQIALLSMELDNHNESIDDSLVTMATKCKNLRELLVNAIVAVDTIDEICMLQTEGEIDLHTFHVTTCGLSAVDHGELWFIKEKHLPVMQTRGLNFQIDAGYFTDTVF